MDEEIAYTDDVRAHVTAIEDKLLYPSREVIVSDLKARVAAIEAKPASTSAIDEVKFREQLNQIDIRLSDMVTSLVQHNQRITDAVIECSKYGTDIEYVNVNLKQNNADLNDVAKVLNSHIEEQRVISAHIFGTRTASECC